MSKSSITHLAQTDYGLQAKWIPGKGFNEMFTFWTS